MTTLVIIFLGRDYPYRKITEQVRYLYKIWIEIQVWGVQVQLTRVEQQRRWMWIQVLKQCQCALKIQILNGTYSTGLILFSSYFGSGSSISDISGTHTTSLQIYMNLILGVIFTSIKQNSNLMLVKFYSSSNFVLIGPGAGITRGGRGGGGFPHHWVV